MPQPFKWAHKNNANLMLSQKGAVLILLAFILGLGAAVYLLKSFNAANLHAAQNIKTYKTLGNAKQALIAWAISHENRPGQLPFPDRNNDGNYDGNSDCNSPVSTFSYTFLLGQLPIYGQTNPCVGPQVGIGDDFHDAQGNRLWYAVSRNLVHKYELPSADLIINPSIIDTPLYPWLRVLDRNGTLISDRVAAVLIAPGSPISTQNRSSAIPNPIEFLDTFQIGGTSYSNANYDISSEDFIVGLDSRNVTSTDTNYTKPYFFNDLLVFITIDELMSALNNRAASEASHLLNQYQVKNGRFPYAAELGATLNNHVSSGVNEKGMLPIDVTDSCGCSSATRCSCSFSPITSVAFRRGGGAAWTSSTGCTRSGAICTCTGAGSCTRGARTFSCNSSGLCTHNVGGATNRYTYAVPSYADIPLTSGNCSISGTQVICNNAGTFSVGLKEPIWFKTNLWQDYIYYAWSPVSDLQFGTRSGLNAILINAGNLTTSEIGRIQIRPSTDIRDYLDSLENTNNNTLFDAANKQKTDQYNDQTFVVGP